MSGAGFLIRLFTSDTGTSFARVGFAYKLRLEEREARFLSILVSVLLASGSLQEVKLGTDIATLWTQLEFEIVMPREHTNEGSVYPATIVWRHLGPALKAAREQAGVVTAS